MMRRIFVLVDPQLPVLTTCERVFSVLQRVEGAIPVVDLGGAWNVIITGILAKICECRLSKQ